MAVIDQWHPLCRVREVLKKPQSVIVDGRALAVFKTESGRLGVLDDACPHRRMRLSRGKVCGERLQCCYHGWTYDTEGNGESPGTPKLSARAQAYETHEAFGWIWARRSNAETTFPDFDIQGYKLIGDFLYSFDLPLELVVDNFTEAEHTGAVHVYFGYPIERLNEVECKVTCTDDSVSVRNYGPNKSMGLINRVLMGIKKNFNLIDSWTTYFSPLFSVYSFDYDDPISHEPGKLHQRAVFFFIPEGPSRTRVMVLLYVKYDIPLLHKFTWPFHPLLRHRFHYEVLLDQRLLEGLTDHDPSIHGMKLSRFDKVLALNRERIDRIYRQEGARKPLEQVVPADAEPTQLVGPRCSNDCSPAA